MENQALQITHAEAEEKVRAMRREAEKEAAALQKAYDKEKQEYIRAMLGEGQAEHAFQTAQKQCKQTMDSISRLESKLAGLRGLFSGKRRRELELAIAESKHKLEKEEREKSDLERQYWQAKNALSERQQPVEPELPDERELTYRCAAIYRQARHYTAAALEYDKIRGYRDVDDILAGEAQMTAALDDLKRYSAGSTLTFGRYPQSDDASRGPEPIEWLVLTNDGDKATLISKYALACRKYHSEFKDATWKTCGLRKWLNDEFLNEAFTADEQLKLATLTFKEKGKLRDPNDLGGVSESKVFLLTESELAQGIKNVEERACKPTPYAMSQFQQEDRSIYDKESGNCWWWLRLAGHLEDLPECISDDGIRKTFVGFEALMHPLGVRPSIALRLSAMGPES